MNSRDQSKQIEAIAMHLWAGINRDMILDWPNRSEEYKTPWYEKAKEILAIIQPVEKPTLPEAITQSAARLKKEAMQHDDHQYYVKLSDVLSELSVLTFAPEQTKPQVKVSELVKPEGWRPKDWDNPFPKPSKKMTVDSPAGWAYINFEQGADAMLKALANCRSTMVK